MKTLIDVKERTVSAAMIFSLLLCAGIYSCSSTQAQSVDIRHYSVDTNNPLSQVKNTGTGIRYADEVNMEGKAVSLNANINSAYSELKPAAVYGGNRFYFSRSLHPGNTIGENDLEDIWYAEFDKEANDWSEPIRMAGVLNNAGPNYINNVSITGDTIILGNQYMKKGKMRAGFSYSVNHDGQWSVPMPVEIQDDYNISDHANAFISLKSGIIIEAIQRAETFGERDLYVSFWDGEKGTMPINMGATLNTALEESSPYLAPDNKTLYFASKGHHGFGGYDIYVTKRLDDSWTNWSEPKNLGPAVNGKMDEEFFTITHCGAYAFFSKEVSIHNVDIYRISMEELFGTKSKYKIENKQSHQELLSSLAGL